VTFEYRSDAGTFVDGYAIAVLPWQYRFDLKGSKAAGDGCGA
jgi:hypothetical protein